MSWKVSHVTGISPSADRDLGQAGNDFFPGMLKYYTINLRYVRLHLKIIWFTVIRTKNYPTQNFSVFVNTIFFIDLVGS